MVRLGGCILEGLNRTHSEMRVSLNELREDEGNSVRNLFFLVLQMITNSDVSSKAYFEFSKIVMEALLSTCFAEKKHFIIPIIWFFHINQSG